MFITYPMQGQPRWPAKTIDLTPTHLRQLALEDMRAVWTVEPLEERGARLTVWHFLRPLHPVEREEYDLFSPRFAIATVAEVTEGSVDLDRFVIRRRDGGLLPTRASDVAVEIATGEHMGWVVI